MIGKYYENKPWGTKAYYVYGTVKADEKSDAIEQRLFPGEEITVITEYYTALTWHTPSQEVIIVLLSPLYLSHGCRQIIPDGLSKTLLVAVKAKLKEIKDGHD